MIRPLLSTIMLLTLLMPGELMARPRKAVPLMPRKLELASHSRSEAVYHRSYARRSPKNRGGWGIEVGTLGKKNSTDSSVMGMQLMVGGRVMADFQVWDRIGLRPSVGFFTRSQGEAKVSVAENTIELGGLALYDLTPNSRGKVFVGLANRLDLQFTSISVLESSDSSPLLFNYRVGPTVNFEIPVGGTTRILFNLEATFAPRDSFRPFASATIGFINRVF